MALDKPLSSLLNKVVSLVDDYQLRQNPVLFLGQSTCRNAKALVRMTLSRLDIVSCDEFEQQNVILANLASRVENLQTQITELEKTSKPTSKPE